MTGTHVASGSPTQVSKTASSRGPPTSPPNRSPTTTPTQRMPSPRPSPAMRPVSPLSPRYESTARFEPLQPPSPRSVNARTGNSQRRANTNSLKLPSLPRFHPANFASANTSAQTTPDSPSGSPQPPASPRAHQRMVSDAQKHLLIYQREMVSVARSSTPTQLDNPESPRLLPLGSPGPVTPLELENSGGYLVAGARDSGRDAVPSEELIEKLVEEETLRRQRSSHSSSPSRQGAR